MKKRILLLLCIVGAVAICGCSAFENGHTTSSRNTTSFFAMDTYMEITTPLLDDPSILENAKTHVQDLDALLSVTNENSELWKLNHAGGKTVTLSSETVDILSEALSYCDETHGALNIALYPIVCKWGFTTGNYQVPTKAQLDSLLPLCDYTKIDIDGNDVTIDKDMALDLGAIAKGYASDKLASYLRTEGVDSALIVLGGNVYALGEKTKDTPWKIGVQSPSGNGVAGTLALRNQAAVTSGSYERYFEENGVTYHHIIDPSTGYPAESGLVSVTIVSESGTMGDALSTAIFVMGCDEAITYWREHEGFEMILITDDDELIYTEGLSDIFTPSMGYETKIITN